jgi:hypothetical protein
LGFLNFESGLNVRLENKSAWHNVLLYLGYSILATQKCGLDYQFERCLKTCYKCSHACV